MGLQVVQFPNKGDVEKVLELSAKESWSAQYLGNNTFAFSEEQLKKIEAEKIVFIKKSAPSPR